MGKLVDLFTVAADTVGSLVVPWSLYKATPATRADGQGGPLQSDPGGSLLTNGTWVAGGTIADLTAAYQVAALTTGTGLRDVPDRGALGLLEIAMAVGDATTTSITVKLTRDAAGDILLAGPTTVVPEPGQTTATSYSIVVDYQRVPYDRGNIGTSGTIYAWVKAAAVPAGTQLTTIRLHGEYR